MALQTGSRMRTPGLEDVPEMAIKIICDGGLTVYMLSNYPAIAWSGVGKVQHLVGCPPVVVVSHLFSSCRAEPALMTVDITMPSGMLKEQHSSCSKV